MKQFKRISKYIVNILNMLNVLLLGISEIWGFNLDKVSATIILVAGIGSTWFTTGKLFSTKEE